MQNTENKDQKWGKLGIATTHTFHFCCNLCFVGRQKYSEWSLPEKELIFLNIFGELLKFQIRDVPKLHAKSFGMISFS